MNAKNLDGLLMNPNTNTRNALLAQLDALNKFAANTSHKDLSVTVSKVVATCLPNETFNAIGNNLARGVFEYLRVNGTDEQVLSQIQPAVVRATAQRFNQFSSEELFRNGIAAHILTTLFSTAKARANVPGSRFEKQLHAVLAPIEDRSLKAGKISGAKRKRGNQRDLSGYDEPSLSSKGPLDSSASELASDSCSKEDSEDSEDPEDSDIESKEISNASSPTSGKLLGPVDSKRSQVPASQTDDEKHAHNTKIRVDGWSSEPEELSVRAMFDGYGAILDVHIVKQPKLAGVSGFVGYVLVTFGSHELAKRAISSFKKRKHKKSGLILTWARDEGKQNLADASDDRLAGKNGTESRSVVKHTPPKNREYDGTKITTGEEAEDPNNTKVLFKNLLADLPDDGIQAVFGGYGLILHIRKIYHPSTAGGGFTGKGIITFATHQAALKAIQGVDGKTKLGGKLSVGWAGHFWTPRADDGWKNIEGADVSDATVRKDGKKSKAAGGDDTVKGRKGYHDTWDKHSKSRKHDKKSEDKQSKKHKKA